ncbi:sushi, von Willebrand factor type A, EGF and pentraxin domain-containing protein 1-like [Gigantopelta aegis]|uniref:sushi, von Willebrand factor type A, EGF and pentraxin domain-containing protein 1-like n=1 Tax=Gigantopelta aegis TaxID=1735272 RepID=UPI001B888819|nr:sushi, von Willebrand factor type A, EGF and pentraxin domain-containing protein 1-like [Gigantopelta aegis]
MAIMNSVHGLRLMRSCHLSVMPTSALAEISKHLHQQMINLQRGPNPCNNRTCNQHDVCASIGIVQHKCLSIVESMDAIHSLTKQLYVGETLKYAECLLFYVSDMSCGPPATLANTDVIFSATTTGSEANYTCKSGYNYVSGTSVSTCHSDSLWSTATIQCQVADCGPLSNTSEIHVTYSSTVFGSTALLNCVDGFHPNNMSTTCQANGTWSDFNLLCTGIECGVPSTISGSDLTYTSTIFPSDAIYTCKTGYVYVSGSNTSTCQTDGQWSDPHLNCTGIGCGVPSSTQGADVTYSSTIFPSVANYTCANGYVYVSGSNSSTCDANGQWSDPALNCTGIECGVPNTIPGSDLTYVSTIFPSDAIYTCASGYVYVSGSKSSTCQANGQWSDPALNCTGIDCGIPNDIAGADLTYSSTIFLSVASYTCKPGYDYVSGSNSSTCQANGQWFDPILTCTGINCGNPTSKPNSFVLNSSTRFPSVAYYMCAPGYVYNSGSNTSTCQQNGTWTDSELNCSGLDCSAPSSIYGSDVSYSSTIFPTTADYTCKTGYVYVSGSNSSVCQSNGQWSDPGLNCTGIDCGTPINIPEADLTYSNTIFPSVASYTCKTGYVYVSRSNSSTCQANGQWSDLTLICTGVDCSAPSSISGSDVSYSSTIFPTTADYTCKTGYVYVSGSNTSTCQSNGQWSDPALNCAGIDCGAPINISEADVTYSSTVFPSVATYTCKTGYVYVSGSNSSTCQSNGQWSGPALNCTEIDCGTPIIIFGATTTFTTTTYLSVTHYACATVYVYVSGSNTSTCQANGQWSHPALHCIVSVMCPVPSPIANGHVAYDSLSVNSVANYSCVSNFFYFGYSNRSVCQTDGAWAGRRGSCVSNAFPMHGIFAGPVTAGWKVEVLATPCNEERTTVELRYDNGAYRAIHIDIRFNYGGFVNTVVRNMFTSAGWGYANSTQPYFPFAIGRPFNLTVVTTVSSGFDIYVDGAYFITWGYNGVDFTQVNQVTILIGADIDLIQLYN